MGNDICNFRGKTLEKSLQKNLSLLSGALKRDDMLRIRKTVIAKTGVSCALVFMDGMVSSDFISDSIVRALINSSEDENFKVTADSVSQNILYSSEIKKCDDLSELLLAVSYGDTVMLIDTLCEALIINTKGWRFRGIQEPPNERFMTGPREGFDEAALLNVAQIRRKLLTPDFCVTSLTVGRRTGTKVYLCFLGTLADNKTVEKIKERIKGIDIDGVLDPNYIAEEICQKRDFLFSTVGTTERPDVAAARILEGRIAVIVDGSPTALTIPFLFSENFQSGEDYYQNFLLGSAARILRIISFAAACFLPATYIALVSFHAGFLPTFSALAVLKLRTGIPISTPLECIIIIIILELLKEACSRAAKDIGTALSIVGGLVLGEAAVDTKTVSAPALIIVALAGLCSAILPRLRQTVLIINLTSSILAGFFGIIGVFTCVCVTVIYILNIKSFGFDYTLSLNTPSYRSFKDVFFRTSWKNMIYRPNISKDKKRQKNEK